MTFIPNSKVRLCSVPFSDYTNVLSFKKDDNARANYFIGKTVHNLTDDSGYSYVKGNRALRVNINKEKLYNVNYMMFQNANFGNKWFYAFITKINYINANVSELKFTIDVWQSWESAIEFGTSYIKRQHIKKTDDVLGANLKPENFTGIIYQEEKNKTKDLKRYTSGYENNVIIIMASEWYNNESGNFQNINNTSMIDGNYSGLYLIPFRLNTLISGEFQNYLKKYTDGAKAEAISSIYIVPIDFAYSVNDDSSINIRFKNGIPIGYYSSTGSIISFSSSTQTYQTDKLTSFNTSNNSNYIPENKKLLSFPFTKIILTNNNGSSVTLRQEFFSKNYNPTQLSFHVQASPLLPVTVNCHPLGYIEGDEINGLSLNGFPQCSWIGDTYSRWLAQNQNTVAYQDWVIDLNTATGVLDIVNSTVSNLAQGVSGALLGDTESSANTQNAMILPNAGYNFTKLLINQHKQREKINTSLADKIIQPNYSAGNLNSSNINIRMEKACFSVIYQRVIDEQLKQIDDYFSKFGYAINEFKTITYNRSNFDYIETEDILLYGDIPQDDIETLKEIFNAGVRIWHKAESFLNFNVSNN